MSASGATGDTMDLNTTPFRESKTDLPLPAIQKPPSVRRKAPRPVGILASKWTNFKERRRGKSAAPLDLRLAPKCGRGESYYTHPAPDEVDEECYDVGASNDEGVVDEVVVDRSWFDDFKLSSHVEGDEASISYHSERQLTTPPTSVHEQPIASRAICQPLFTLWDRTCSFLMEYFSSRFPDPKLEADHQKEVWGQSKRLALWASTFFIANWILGVAFIQGPIVLSDKIFYYGVSATVLHC
jgi:osomolarity two-component system sensor histidine kinase SLN1